MNVSAIVVTYNRIKLLKKCIKGLLNQTYSLNSIFIINNDSTDDTKSYLNNLNNNRIHVINMTKNLGGAGGFSNGTRIAFEHSKANYFWLMDDDSVPDKDALSNLLSSAKELNNNFGFLCSNVRWWKNNEPCIANVPRVSYDWNNLLNLGLVKLTNATFVSVLVRRDEIANFGLPISDMFIWGDDTEFTTRLSRHLQSYLVSNSIVIHNSSSNTNGDSGSIFKINSNRIFYYRYEVRNLLYISRKYYNFAKTMKLFLSDLFTLMKIPFYSQNYRFKRFYYMCKGIVTGLFFNPTVKFPKQ